MPDLTISPIQLVRYTVVDVAFRRNMEAEAGPSILFGTDVDWYDPSEATHEDPQFIGLRVRMHTGQPGCAEEDAREQGHVHLIGGVAWAGPPDFDPGQKRRLLYVNGLSLLYGIARTLIAQLSETGGMAPVMLPTVGFQNFADDVDATPPSPDPAPAAPQKRARAPRTSKPKA